MPRKYKTVIRKIAAFPFRIYKLFISPLLPMACLYEPTCSGYLIGSIMRFGVFKGFLLGIARLLRCNSWFFTGGDDAVPEAFSFKAVFLPYREFSRFKRGQ